MKKIAVIGEFYNGFKPHEDLNKALDILKNKFEFEYEWIETDKVLDAKDSLLKNYSGIWSAPGSPFKSLKGALYAIKYARINDIPHLGTCAGFQHAIIEYAQNVLGIKEAQHEEYDNDSSLLFITKLACSISGKTMEVNIKPNTLIYDCYGKEKTNEDYYCNFGINPEFSDKLQSDNLSISGVDQDGEIRIIEYPENRFFVVTLFVPQSRFTASNFHPIILRFVQSVVAE